MNNTLRFYKHIISLTLACCFIVSSYAKSADSSVHTDKIKIAQHEIVYDWSGEGKPILLLHGVFASKSQWHESLKILAQEGYHVVAPDLPGYGKSLGYPLQDYTLDRQVELLHDMVKKMGLKKIAIAGNSMGGAIAALYAKKYPSEVTTLAFIGAPLGVLSPHPSLTDELLKKGVNPFIPLTKSEFDQEMNLLFTDKPIISDEIIEERLTRYKAEKEKDEKIWAMIQTYKHILNKPTSINTSTLIIWGDNDKVFDVSGASILKKNIKHSQLIIFPKGSHLLFIENPTQSIKLYTQFLKANHY